jgi:hypothetical protein
LLALSFSQAPRSREAAALSRSAVRASVERWRKGGFGLAAMGFAAGRAAASGADRARRRRRAGRCPVHGRSCGRHRRGQQQAPLPAGPPRPPHAYPTAPVRRPIPTATAASRCRNAPRLLERKRAVSLKLINIRNGMTWLPTGKLPFSPRLGPLNSVVTNGQCAPAW